MNTSKDTWEEDFDKEFDRRNITFSLDPTHRMIIKDFIRQTITTAVTAERKRLQEKTSSMYIDFKAKTKEHRLAMDDSDVGYMHGVNDIVDRILTLLEDKTV